MRRLAFLIVLAACRDGGPAPASAWPDPAKDAITKVTESGPVKATVQVWPTQPTLGDPLWLRLTVESAPGASATLPVDIDALGRFGVTGWDKSESRRADGGLVQIRNYELALPSSGKHRIPPLRLELVDNRTPSPTPTPTPTPTPSPTPSPSPTPIELLTEEIPIDVAPVLAAKTNAELRAARGALDPQLGRRPWWPFAAGAAALLVAATAGLVLLRRLRERRSEQARISAYDEAIARLAALEAAGAPDADRADAWFVELSMIVRRYLEGRFALRAPELTTEEFLNEARRAGELTPAHRDQLTSFLERCDRVKFAGYRPDEGESLATLRAARSFVDDTRAVAAPPPAMVAHPRAA
jgi:hypothetical protein